MKKGMSVNPTRLYPGVFKGLDKLQLGMSSRQDGWLNVKPTFDITFNMRAYRYRQDFLLRTGTGWQEWEDKYRVVMPWLQHGVDVAVIAGPTFKEQHLEVDAVVSNIHDVLVLLTSADCPISTYYDPTHEIFAMAHSGWRGTAGNITAATIQSMEGLGAAPREIRMFVGPYIGAGNTVCYEVEKNVALRFLPGYEQWCTRKSEKKFSLDLGEIVREQAIEGGLLPEHVEVSRDCTFCNPLKYFSWRRDGEPLRVMATYARMMSR